MSEPIPRAPMKLSADLADLLPGAIAWAEGEESRALASGRSLSDDERALAQKVGVSDPGLIRIQSCERLPMPEDPLLQAAAVEAGLLGPAMIGLTLGHAVFVLRGHETRRLLAHEFRHVFQYERNGSIAGFLPIYLRQIVAVGYDNAPFELDARAHENAAL